MFTRRTSALLLVLVLAGCQHYRWEPFVEFTYGEREGLGISQWDRQENILDDLPYWAGTFGVRYVAIERVLVTPALVPWRPEPDPEPPPLPEPEPDKANLHDEWWHFLGWFGTRPWYVLLAFVALVLGLAWILRHQIRKLIPGMKDKA